MNKMCSRPIGETCWFGQSAFTSLWSVGRSVGRWVPLDTCPLKPSGALRAHKIRTKSTTSARGQVNARPKVRNHLENSLHRKWINNQKHTTNNKVTQNEGDIFFRDRCPWISGKNLRFQDGAWRECNWGGISLPFPKIKINLQNIQQIIVKTIQEELEYQKVSSTLYVQLCVV